LREWNRLDPGVEEFARKGYGYALFPEVNKGGLAAPTAGVSSTSKASTSVMRTWTQGTFGLQAGGQTYSELIVFENKAALERFTQNRLDFSADATAVILKTGTVTNARFVDGIGVIVRPIAGAMAEAAIGGPAAHLRAEVGQSDELGLTRSAQAEGLDAVGAHDHHAPTHRRRAILPAHFEIAGSAAPEALERERVEGVEHGPSHRPLRTDERCRARLAGIEHPHDGVTPTVARDHWGAWVDQRRAHFAPVDGEVGWGSRRRHHAQSHQPRWHADGAVPCGLGRPGHE
jgi:Las17-binding protein actin regulator